jgi:hypothetical protein
MKIQIDVRWPRFLRERPRWARASIVAGVVAAVFAVPVAWANHMFTDVPTSHPFHDAISVIKVAGITAGKTCEPPGTPPTYCPSEPVTREAMAAFMQRGFGRLGMHTVADGTDIGSNFTWYTQAVNASVVVGGLAGGTQYLKAEGYVRLDTSTDVSGNCELAARIVVDPGTEQQQVSGEQRVEWGPAPLGSDIDLTVPVSWVFMVPTTSHTVQVQVSQQTALCLHLTPLDVADSELVTATFPLNHEGSEAQTLGPATASATPTNEPPADRP